MRLKLLLSNIRHHFVLVFFILFVSIFIASSISLAIEVNDFTYHLTEDNYRKDNHDFDIVIKSNTGLSLRGTRGDNGQFESLYKRRTSFYNVTLLAKYNDTSTVTQIFEGTNDDINNSFNQNLSINKNEIVITNQLATKLNIGINNNLTLFIGNNPYTYKVVNIIEGNGLYAGEAAFITGYSIAEHYALRKMYNLILLDVDNENDLPLVYEHLKQEYGNYTINNINDKEYLETLSMTIVDKIMTIVSIVLMAILLLLINMYSKQTKKQTEYFEIVNKQNYYKVYQIMSWIIIIIISMACSYIIVNSYFKYFIKVYDCRYMYQTRLISYILAIIPLILVMILRVIPKIKIKGLKQIYHILISVLLIASIILLILTTSKTINSFFILTTVILSILIIVEIISYLLKYIPSYLVKTYIYDFSKNNSISKLVIIIRISLILVTSITLSTLELYTKQVGDISSLIDIDKVVVTTTPYSNINSYDQIKIDNNINILDTNLSIVVALNSKQYNEYTNYVELTNDERNKFDSDNKYIILTKYYENTFNLDIGDKIEMLVNEQIETYEILKFANHFLARFAVVNKSDYMYYGYVLDDNEVNDEIISNFSEYKYSIVDIKSDIETKQHQYNAILASAKYILISVIVIIILLSIYMAYQEHLYQKDNLIKLKLLGCSNIKMLKITSIKLIIDILITTTLGFISSAILLTYIDKILKNFKTVLYITYNLNIILLSLFIAIICLISSFIYTNIKFKKL